MPHEWIKITLGRVCLACSLAQAAGEFDDEANRPCPKDVPYVPPKPAKKPSSGGNQPRTQADEAAAR